MRATLGGSSVLASVPMAPSSELLTTFPDLGHWFRRETVEALSQEGAHAIAGGLVRHLSREHVPLPNGAALQCDLACAL